MHVGCPWIRPEGRCVRVVATALGRNDVVGIKRHRRGPLGGVGDHRPLPPSWTLAATTSSCALWGCQRRRQQRHATPSGAILMVLVDSASAACCYPLQPHCSLAPSARLLVFTLLAFNSSGSRPVVAVVLLARRRPFGAAPAALAQAAFPLAQ